MSIRRQAIFWLLTVPKDDFTLESFRREHFTDDFQPVPDGAFNWVRGQREIGENTGYEHWQIFVAFKKKQSLAQCKTFFSTAHVEMSRSDAAAEYVWKESTRVTGTQFEFGAKPIRRNSRTDWQQVWTNYENSPQDTPL